MPISSTKKLAADGPFSVFAEDGDLKKYFIGSRIFAPFGSIFTSYQPPSPGVVGSSTGLKWVSTAIRRRRCCLQGRSCSWIYGTWTCGLASSARFCSAACMAATVFTMAARIKLTKGRDKLRRSSGCAVEASEGVIRVTVDTSSIIADIIIMTPALELCQPSQSARVIELLEPRRYSMLAKGGVAILICRDRP